MCTVKVPKVICILTIIAFVIRQGQNCHLEISGFGWTKTSLNSKQRRHIRRFMEKHWDPCDDPFIEECDSLK